jgi:hypothetical protein
MEEHMKTTTCYWGTGTLGEHTLCRIPATHYRLIRDRFAQPLCEAHAKRHRADGGKAYMLESV